MLSFQHSESNWVVYHNSENDWISTHSSPCMQVAILEWSSYCLASLLPSWLEVMSSCLHLTWLSICSKYDILTLGEHAYFFYSLQVCMFLATDTVVWSGPIAVNRTEKWAKVLRRRLVVLSFFASVIVMKWFLQSCSNRSTGFIWLAGPTVIENYCEAELTVMGHLKWQGFGSREGLCGSRYTRACI